MFRWLKELFKLRRAQTTNYQEPFRKPVDSPMNEGDYHSGPYGYSPNTAYPETQYGSGFDEDAEWNEDDWR